MRIYNGKTVLEEAKDRIRLVFDEFEHVMVSFSGGKDSTVSLFLTLEIAREKNRLPLQVVFIDQEAEWQGTVDYCRYIRSLPDIDFKWIQCNIVLFNATSHSNNWLHCWGEGEEHIREKEPGAVTENTFGTKRFKELFGAISRTWYPNERCANIGGVRAEESPARLVSLTENPFYKWITWGKSHNRGKEKLYYGFYPIYDWSYRDVWKYIHENGLPYNKVYDAMFNHGVPMTSMRISNLNHETALESLLLVQEIEPETWNKLVKRIEGVNTHSQLNTHQIPEICPPMFSGWKEYRDYLTIHLTKEPERSIFQKKWKFWDQKTVGMGNLEAMYRVQVRSVILNDYYFTTFDNWKSRMDVSDYFMYKRGIWNPRMAENKYISK